MSLIWVKGPLSRRPIHCCLKLATHVNNTGRRYRCVPNLGSRSVIRRTYSCAATCTWSCRCRERTSLRSGFNDKFQHHSKRFVHILSPSQKQSGMECKRFHKDAIDIFNAAVESVYPPRMIRNAVSISEDGDSFTVDGRQYPLDHNVFLVGFGKAVSGMARALEDLLGKHLVKGIISIPHGSHKLFQALGKEELCIQDRVRIQVFEGAKNNLPDEEAFSAAQAIERLASNLGRNDILIVLISGGGSALLPSPMWPITLTEQQEMTRVLSLGGATIQQLNVLRQNLETLKGGGLAQQASPASVVSLILSDVVGDKLDLISSGPTAPMLSSPRQALQILESLHLEEKVPGSIVSLLQQTASMKKSLQDISPQYHQMKNFTSNWDHVQNAIIGSNSVATENAFKKATELGYVSHVLTNTLQGDCRTAAAFYMEIVKFVIYGYGDIPPDQGHQNLAMTELELSKLGMSKSDVNVINKLALQAYNSSKGICIICGGETTADVTGTGKGGRNQEMALAFAILYNDWLMSGNTKSLDKFHVEFLSAGTDGQDGPTDAAGAVVNKNVIPMSITSKLKAKEFLDNNDSYTFFNSLDNSNCHIRCGLTGTNVMDIQLLIIEKQA